ncbi:hypothetical protein ACSTS3_16740 [Aquimarina muelleri]|uniref:hypothetical protein n=1 Tax=Aquimarina muelleri TaxID=279356 RepID=UPI003F684C01
MKNIIVLISFLFFITNCKEQKTQSLNLNKEKLNKNFIEERDTVTFIKEKPQNKDFSFIDSMTPLKLRIGNKSLIEYEFPKEWNFGSPYDSKRKVSNDEKKINRLLGFYEGYKSEKYKVSKREIKSLSFFLNVENDYRNITINFEKIFEYSIARFPNKNDSVQVLGLWFSKERLNPDKEFPFSVSYGELIVIKGNKIIDQITLNHFEGNYSLGGDYRLSYIDNDYIIHTKDFNYGENQGYFIRYEKWKIKNNGKIVRFFNQQDTILNEGEVKNHLKSGNWKDLYLDRNLAYKNKKWGIENLYSYSEGEYNQGEKIGEWKFYSYKNNTKGELLYTETYKDGELVERVFIK